MTSVVTDPAVPGRVFASSTGESKATVRMNSDQGRSWQQPNPHFNFCTIHSYAVVEDGVYRTTDGGDTWFDIMTGLDAGQEFYEILVDRHDSQVLYLAAQDQGIMVSTDAGNNWRSWNEGPFNKRPGTNGNNVTRCLILSADGELLCFGSAGAGVFQRKTL